MPSATLQQPSQQNIIAVGIFTIVHRLSDTVVRKVPRASDTGDLPGNIQAVRNEARIYALLSEDHHIAKCLSRGQTEDYVDLEYYSNGTLMGYIKKNKGDIPDTLRMRWGLQIIEAVVLIHKLGIIHSDLALRQYLLDNNLNARLCDFGASGFPGQEALGLEGASHCLPRDFDLPNTIDSDLFALGSTLYELGVGEAPYHGVNDNEIADRYARGIFPSVSGIFCGDIILGCWKVEFVSAEDVLSRYEELINNAQYSKICCNSRA